MPLPELFVEQMRALLPANELENFIKSLGESDPEVSVRINSAKYHSMPDTNIVPWCNKGFYIDHRPQFTFDPALHSGVYYVQDASSMFLAYAIDKLVDKTKPVRYLDLCAAPGGKTTTAVGALPEGSLVVANEIMNNRAQILKENIIKWGNPNCVVTCNDSAAYSRLTHFFDIIAADVPCSGEGMMRKDDEAVAQWTPALVRECAERQREIVDNAWQALRPGGLLIYSTCTFNQPENENIVEYLVNEYGAESIDLAPPAEWDISTSINSPTHGYHFFPHRTRGEGLFLAVVRKPDGEMREILRPSKNKKNKKDAPVQVPKEVKEWISNPKSMQLMISGDSINAIPIDYSDEITILNEYLRVISQGCKVATIKGKDLIPAHALALNTIIEKQSFPSCEVGYTTAIAFLRGETIVVDAPRGFVLITYNNIPIGWVKNLGNRSNNLYPKEWRIKSTHIPTIAPKVV